MSADWAWFLEWDWEPAAGSVRDRDIFECIRQQDVCILPAWILSVSDQLNGLSCMSARLLLHSRAKDRVCSRHIQPVATGILRLAMQAVSGAHHDARPFREDRRGGMQVPARLL